MRFVDGGYLIKCFLGLTGRFVNPPPQFGHTFLKMIFAQSLQKVHSKVQIIASVELWGRSIPQCSQHGRISNIFAL